MKVIIHENLLSFGLYLIMNNIHPTALIGPGVALGTGNVIGPNVVICGPAEIGNDNWIGPGSIIGTPGEYQGREHPVSWEHGSSGLIRIGSRNVIREMVTIHVSADTTTSIGDDCYIMSKCYIPHDAVIEDEVKLATTVLLGGYVHVGKAAYIGMGAIVHQRLVIGAGSMVGMGSVVTRHVPPLAKAFGSPAVVRGINHMKFDYFALSERDIEDFHITYSTGNVPAKNELSAIALGIYEDFESIVQGQESSY
jgi:UDP-N-acetylglucosamine acyltransferase